ncbi:MAG TPA: hypothetical protein PKY53_03225 [Clostridia bacterium]|nr:hypothetical protein [Clostridia bacterium]
MKKPLVILFAIAFCLGCFAPVNFAYANSALMQRKADGEYAELLPVKDPEIGVSDEQLTFDFSQGEEGEFAPLSATTAVYDIRNFSAQDKTVTMGFPLSTTLKTFREHSAAVTINGQAVEYTPYFAFAELKNLLDATFEELLEAINGLERLDENLSVWKYTIDVRDINETRNAEIEYEIAAKSDTFVIADNVSGYSTAYQGDDDSVEKVTLKVFTVRSEDEPSYINLYAVGGEVQNLKVRRIDDESKKAGAEYGHVFSTEQMSLRNYILSFEEDITPGEYDLISVALSDKKNGGKRFVEEFEFKQQIFNSPCVILLGYTVTLKAGERNLIGITYTMDGAFDAHYNPTLFTYDYISSPAKNWASFDTFFVKVITPEKMPYLIKSNVAFTKTGENEYSYTQKGAPDYNIRFSLCADEDPRYTKPSNIFGSLIVMYIVYGVIALCAAGMVTSGIVIIVKSVQKKKGKEENGKDTAKGD